ncbi:hypothetical protein [Nocardia seriolae]|uniref:hypothetical protein n=1 Tax=Nocardia seriolae TaxID=37332 RepID=UPI0008FF50D5|nr:hypothetical protein [Nocardia seriolae]OJF78019.1 hypothetical protein NS14008_00845 [Nocardia seriolae]PSK31776.1 hypothetical protein C6575_08220 [Nocardia seriolae]QOW31777.1 hypothetical protein IMZ23_27500 [Nocardia seriolae]QUN19385.1 hypothetical protein KEC46_08575 [Nocardia seriolae]WNJ58830.1 hypothetical protein RMO66_36715 [Nocardia seriolae]
MTKFLAVLSGLLLAAAVAIVLPWAVIPVAVFAVAGWRWRVSTVLAVLSAMAALAWIGTGALVAGGIGLVATTYLLNTATVSAPVGVVPTTVPSVAGALVFTAAAGAATVLPAGLTWIPILAPFTVILLYALLVRGLVDDRATHG